MYWQVITRFRPAGIDSRGNRKEPGPGVEFHAVYAPGSTQEHTNYRQTFDGSSVFYVRDMKADIRAGDSLHSTYPVDGKWRVVGTKAWVNPYSGTEWGLEVLVEDD